MKMIKKILVGLAVLALAIIIVDCNENLQEVLEQQASNVASGPLVADIESKPKVDRKYEASSEMGAASKATSQVSVTKDTKPAGKGQAEAYTGTQMEEKGELVGQEPKVPSRQKPKLSEPAKTNKHKVNTIRIPDEPELVVVNSSHSESREEQDGKLPSLKDDKSVHTRANSTTEDTRRLPAEDDSQQRPAKEEKPTKKQEVKGKSDKKAKNKSIKRDKRETKKSGSSKNSKTKRSAEKSKKYESKKKSKK